MKVYAKFALSLLFITPQLATAQIRWELADGAPGAIAQFFWDDANQNFFAVGQHATTYGAGVAVWDPAGGGTHWRTVADFSSTWINSSTTWRSAYDPIRRRVVCVGLSLAPQGFPQPPNSNYAIAEWDMQGSPSSWTLTWPANWTAISPGGWQGDAIYDPVRQKTVIIDDDGSGVAVWEWDGQVLARQPLTGGPQTLPRSVAWNPAPNRIMAVEQSGTIWELGVSGWVPLPPPFPQPAFCCGLYHDPGSSTMALEALLGTVAQDNVQYHWDGLSWAMRYTPSHFGIIDQLSATRLLSPSVASRPGSNELLALVHSFLHGPFLARGTPSQVGRIATIGAGCLGPHGMPPIQVAQGSTPVPVLGGTFEIQWSGVTPPPFGGGTVLLGFDSQHYGALSLPLELSLIGMPGCYLNESVDYRGTGNPNWQVGIPNTATLEGLTFYLQIMGLELFTPTGPYLTMTPTMACTIGSAY